MRLTAYIISAIFQPLLMPSLVYYAALFHIDNSTNLTDGGKWTVLSLVFLTTCIIPVLTVLMFRYTRIIKDIHMTRRKDRYLPFVFISIFYLVVTILFHRQIPLTPLLSVILIAITGVVILTNFITFFWKISAHSAGVAGLVGFILIFASKNAGSHTLLLPLVASILLAGAIMWARLYLQAHKLPEILGGVALGFIVSYGSIYFFV